MKLFFAILSFLFCAGTLAQKRSNTVKKTTIPTGYEIKITLKPYANQWVYIGCYYGKFKNLVDSVLLDKQSQAIWSGNSKLAQGIYFFASPTKSQLNDFLIDKNQHFTIIADSANPATTSFTGSLDNNILNGYTQYISSNQKQLQSLNEKLKTANHTDSVQYQNQIRTTIQSFEKYRQNIIKTQPQSMMAQYFQVMQRPVFPTIVHKDTAGAYAEYRAHFWDNTDFSDDKNLRTPFFESKLDDYFQNLVSPQPDSIINEVNYMLLASRDGAEMHKYLLGKFTDQYINPKIMGQDKVFLFLFNNYFSKGDTTWLKPEQTKFIFNRAYNLMANQVGSKAPALALKDSTGNAISLSSLQAPYTFVIFWDPECSHCKIIVPQIDSIYQAKWKALGIKIYAVNTAEENVKDWKIYINEHHLQDWVHVSQSKEEREADANANRPNYRQLFDVYETPTMLLLDKDKNIVAKKLSLEQFDGLISARVANK